MTPKNQSDDQKIFDLIFGVRRSVRYHHRRAGFLGSLHRITMFCNLFMALGAGLAVHNQLPLLATSLVVLVALAATADATADSANNCAKHMLLAYRFQELEKKISVKTLSDQEYESAVHDRLSIEQDEPVPLRLLDVLCHYELMISMGHDETLVPEIPWYRRLLSQFWTQAEYAQRLARQ